MRLINKVSECGILAARTTTNLSLLQNGKACCSPNRKKVETFSVLHRRNYTPYWLFTPKIVRKSALLAVKMLLLALALLCCAGVCHSFMSKVRTRSSSSAVSSIGPMKIAGSTGFPLQVVTVSRDHVQIEVTNFVEEEEKEGETGFELPKLTFGEKKLLLAGERIQRQERNGASGQGMVVLDVEADPDAIFDALTKFDEYGQMIPTVRKSSVLSARGNNYEVCTCALSFTLHSLKSIALHAFYSKPSRDMKKV